MAGTTSTAPAGADTSACLLVGGATASAARSSPLACDALGSTAPSALPGDCGVESATMGEDSASEVAGATPSPGWGSTRPGLVARLSAAIGAASSGEADESP